MHTDRLIGNPRAYILFADKIRSFYDNEAKSLEAMQLKTSHARLLHFLLDFEGLSQKDICVFFHLRPSTMSELLTEAEKDGYIERKVNPENKRMVSIYLTPKGRETANRIYSLFESYCRHCMDSFTKGEQALFEELLIRFVNAE